MEYNNHIEGFQQELKKIKENSQDSFFSWFNNSKDSEQSFIRGNWDLFIHILSHVVKYINSPEGLIALEIGHGGGRILSAAARCFHKVYGVDIHNENEIVANKLSDMGLNNFELIKSDGKSIPLPDNSVDFVYSFIVFQHLEKIEIFKKYMQETYRILKPKGLAVIYFGRHYYFSLNKKSMFLVAVDRLLEKIMFKRYSEIDAPINHTNLKVSLSYAKKIAKETGFEVLKTMISRKNVPDGYVKFGGQYGFVIKR